jgi:chemotaxis protein histidine kinase CheA
VRARAQDLGRPADSESQLLDALFAGGLSTREAVSEISGRGAGMAACKAACDALGGQIRVATQLGQGTTFQFTFPVEGHPRPPGASARRFQAQVIQSA